MAGTNISVNKQSVSELLKTGRTKPFIIPEYQRPYAWTSDEVTTLFDDLWEFATTIGGIKNNGNYFMGSIVSFENESKEQEIIDGQQRITTLFLLLRAIYSKLINGDDANSDAAQNFIRQIEPAVWRTDNLTGKVDFTDILLTSRVVDNEGNSILRKILETGHADEALSDNYSKNYITLQKLYNEKCKHSPFMIYDFIYALLNQAILLPISADSQDTALTIFSTLNNRGLQLSDADIFKAKIYNNLKDTEKDEFISKWKNLEREASEVNESIQQLFYYYMFYLRAKENDVSSSTPGVRKYYSGDKFVRLYTSDLMDNLSIVLNLWKVINANQDIPGESWDNNPQIRQALDTLTSYPNEFWKYPVIIYYLSHRDNLEFESLFLKFLNKLISELLVRFLLYPTINVVKADIMKLNARIIADVHPDFSFRNVDKTGLENRIRLPHRNIVRMTLKVCAYNHQEKLLPDNWQIEHILPQKWQPTFFTNVEPEIVNEYIEHIGNKVPFERKLNITASNGYFKKKQQEYEKSEIEITRALIAASIDNDWTLEHIKHRDDVLVSEILKLIEKWELEYTTRIKSSNGGPSDEEKALIEKFKNQGWI